MANRTEQLMENVRKMPIFRQLVPQEAGIGWPIPLHKGGKAYVTLPFFGYTPGLQESSTKLFPPFAIMTFEWSNLMPVEYVNLRFRNPWPEGQWEGQVGTFPHPAVSHIKVTEYKARRSELLAMYDEMFDTLDLGESLPPFQARRFGQLLRLLMEPALEPYYRALSPQFFEHFLLLGEQSDQAVADAKS
jgi:hypothetical protein